MLRGLPSLKSVYEVQSKSGRWPAQIADLEGTANLRMPYRREVLEREAFVLRWPQDLDPNPQANRAGFWPIATGGCWHVWGWSGSAAGTCEWSA
jgi:hypothetical protein